MAKAKAAKTAKSSAKPAAAAKSKVTVTNVKAETKPAGKKGLASDLALGALFAELVGTFALTLALLNAQGNFVIAVVAVIVLVLVLGRLSGGHINPIVTVGLMATRQMPVLRGVGYLIAQTLGAMLALVVATKFVEGTMNPMTGEDMKAFAVTALQGDWKPFFAEMLAGLLFSFGVASAVMGKKEGFEAAFTIGGALFIALVVAALGSSAIVNPAVALGLSAYDTGNLWTIGVYLVAPLLGGVAGMWLYKLLQWDVDHSKTA